MSDVDDLDCWATSAPPNQCALCSEFPELMPYVHRYLELRKLGKTRRSRPEFYRWLVEREPKLAGAIKPESLGRQIRECVPNCKVGRDRTDGPGSVGRES